MAELGHVRADLRAVRLAASVCGCEVSTMTRQRPVRGERWSEFKRYEVDLFRQLNHGPFAFGLLSLTGAGLGIWSLIAHGWRWGMAIGVLGEVVLGIVLIVAYYRVRED